MYLSGVKTPSGLKYWTHNCLKIFTCALYKNDTPHGVHCSCHFNVTFQLMITVLVHVHTKRFQTTYAQEGSVMLWKCHFTTASQSTQTRQ